MKIVDSLMNLGHKGATLFEVKRLIFVTRLYRKLMLGLTELGPVCRIPVCRNSTNWSWWSKLENFFPTNWIIKFNKLVFKLNELDLSHTRSQELHRLKEKDLKSEMWGKSGVCTLALTVVKLAPTTIASRSPFPLGLCSRSTSLNKMGTYPRHVLYFASFRNSWSLCFSSNPEFYKLEFYKLDPTNLYETSL